ncbi:hypothetical protein BH09VER1_BH09VER1_17480 [soil metagenome]
MNKIAHVCMGVLCLSMPYADLLAQTLDKDPQPKPPYVLVVPKKFSWVMTIKSAPVASSASQPVAGATPTAPSVQQIKELQYARVEDLQRVVVMMSDGQAHEFYDFKSFHLGPTNVPGKILVLSDQPAPADQPPPPPYPYYATGFYGLDWIKPEYYTGIEKYKGGKYFHYQSPKSGPTQEAWIEIETQFPIALRRGAELFEFERTTIPDTLALPPAYQAAWDKYRTGQARLEALKALR